MPPKIESVPEVPLHQPVVASHEGWTVQSASINPPSESELRERLGAPAPGDAATAAASAEAATPAVEPAAEPEVAKPAAEKVEAAKAPAAEPVVAGEQAPPAKPKRGSVEHRIAQATYAQREAERKAAEATARVEQLTRDLEAARKPPAETPKTAAAPAAQGKPKPVWAEMEAAGHTYDEFLDARDDWSRTEIVAAAEAKAADIIRSEQAKARESSDAELRNRVQAQRVAQHHARLDAERKITPNFDELVDPTLPLSAPMRESIVESEIGPKVMLYLNAHPEECERISQLHPVLAIREMGKIEGILSRELAATSGSTSSASSVTKANPPVRPAAGSRAAPAAKAGGQAEAEFNADWVRQENERERQARARRV